jgi:hypothetical protein
MPFDRSELLILALSSRSHVIAPEALAFRLGISFTDTVDALEALARKVGRFDSNAYENKEE